MVNRKAQRLERLEWIRRLLLEGVPEWKIRQRLRTGMNVAPEGAPPKIFKVSAATVTKDFADLGEEWRLLHDDPAVAERVAGAVVQRLTRIALAAEAAKRYTDAIRANALILRTVGIRHDRWRVQQQPTRIELSGPEGNPIQIAAISLDLSQLTGPQLQHVLDADEDSLHGLFELEEVPKLETG